MIRKLVIALGTLAMFGQTARATPSTVYADYAWVFGVRDMSTHQTYISPFKASFEKAGDSRVFMTKVPDGGRVQWWTHGTDTPMFNDSRYMNYGTKVETASSNFTFSATINTPQQYYVGVVIDYFPFTVSFDANEGQGTMPKLENCFYTNNIPLPANEFVKKGYDFAGWSLMKGGSATIEDKATVTGKELGVKHTTAIALYATWRAKTYSVTLDRQGGTGGSETVNATYASSMPKITRPTRAHYSFNGYWTEPDGKGVCYYKASGESARVWDMTTEKSILYADWTRLTHTVAVEESRAGDGTGSVQVEYIDADGDVQRKDGWANYQVPEGASLTLTAKPAAGSRFEKWLPSGVKENPLTLTVVEPTTNAAVFMLESYLVSFVYTNATSTEVTSNIWVKHGQNVAAAAVPTREEVDRYPGYRFVTWMGSFSNMLAKATVKAQYEYIREIAIFDTNFIGGGAVTNVYEKGETYGARGLWPADPMRYGYDFLGWFTAKSTGEKVTADMPVVKTGEVRYYAHWEPKLVRVTFDPAFVADGVTPVVKDLTFGGRYGQDGTVSFGRRGYTQKDSWRTNETKTVTLNDYIKVSEAHTLYATWDPVSYTLTYWPSRNRGSPSKTSVTYDAVLSLGKPKAEPGYSFTGYYTNEACSGTAYFNAEMKAIGPWPWLKDEVDALYSGWTANVYRVTFNPNGGEVTPVSKEVTYGERFGDLPTPHRTGYDFGGWEYGGKKYFADDKYDIAGNVELVAQWNAIAYDLDCYSTRDRKTKKNVRVKYGDDWPGGLDIPTETGYSFTGYYTNELCTGGAYLNAEMHARGPWPWLKEEVPALYSGWTANVYRVTFNPNGGEVAPVSKAVAYRAKFGELPTPYRVGYVFGGWEYGGEKLYSADDEYDHTEDIELVARWSVCVYSVAFFGNGGTNELGDVQLQDFVYGEPQDLVSNTFVRAGYEFRGWDYDPTNAVEAADFSDGSRVVDLTDEPNGIVRLYARWEKIGEEEVTSELSKWIGCALNLHTPDGKAAWEMVTVNNIKCLKAKWSYDDWYGWAFERKPAPANFTVQTIAPKSGRMSFHFMMEVTDQGDRKYESGFAFSASDVGGQQDMVYWYGNSETNVNDLTIGAGCIGEWSFQHAKNAPEDYPKDYAFIDRIDWVPDQVITGVGLTFRRNDGTEAPADIVTNVTLLSGSEIGDWSAILPYGAEGWSTNGIDLLPETWEVPNAVAGIQLFALNPPEPPDPMAYEVRFIPPPTFEPIASMYCTTGKVYKLPSLEGYRWKSSVNNRLYDGDLLIFDLAKPRETVRMTALEE